MDNPDPLPTVRMTCPGVPHGLTAQPATFYGCGKRGSYVRPPFSTITPKGIVHTIPFSKGASDGQ